MSDFRKRLLKGDMRTTGESDKIVTEVLSKPSLFPGLFSLILDDSPAVRMRAADAVEKLSAKHPEYLRPFKKTLIEEVARIPQQEVRWHTAQMLSYLTLNTEERQKVAEMLLGWYKNERKSRIVKALCLQALSDISKGDKSLRPGMVKVLTEASRSGVPSLESRARRLLTEIARQR